MSSKEVNEKFIDFISGYYLEKNFKQVKKLNAFILGDKTVSFSFSSYPGSISVRPQFKIENEKIKEIFIDALGTKESPLTILRVQDMEFAFECGVHDDKITFSKYNCIPPEIKNPDILSVSSYYYSIDENTDLSPIFEDHQYYMEKVTFPFFEKMSTLEGIDSFLNDVITAGDMPFFYSEHNNKFLKKFRTKREILNGVIAAKLNKRKNYDELLNRIKLLWEGNDYILNDFHMLVDYLENKGEID